MKRRLILSGVVGAVNFVVVFIVSNFAHFHSFRLRHPQHDALAGLPLIYAVLFGSINAIGIFAAGAALQKPSDAD